MNLNKLQIENRIARLINNPVQNENIIKKWKRKLNRKNLGADIFVEEIVAVSDGGKITVSETPARFGNDFYGWYCILNNSDYFHKLVFNDRTATVDGVPIGTAVKVKYFIHDKNAISYKI